MNSFSERLMLHLRYLAIKPVMMIIGFQFFIFLTVRIVPDSTQYVVCNQNVFYGEVWRLLTATFSHSDTGHFIFNMLFIFMLGRWCYETLGHKHVIILTCISGITVNLLHISIYSSAILGISGVTFALLVACCAKDPHARMLFFPAWIFASVLVFLQFLGFLNSFNSHNMDHVAYDAHLFGAIIGYGSIALRKPLAVLQDKIKDKKSVQEEIIYSQNIHRFDQLLEKISTQGLHTLSDQERIFLKKHSDYERQRKAHRS